MNIQKIVDLVNSYNPSPQIDLLKEGYKFAQDAHKGQLRFSSEPYISHPLWVAYILAQMHLDIPTIVAGLLHDAIEDTDLGYEDLKVKFGVEIADLVDGVSKIGKIVSSSKEEERAENIRKMLIAMAKDVRVILIKLADRLHNMRTLKYLGREAQIQIAHETLNIYAPIAHRLGMGRIKWELEDLSFLYLEPEAYHSLKKKVAKARGEREGYIKEVSSILQRELEKAGIEAKISGRPKHFFSIHKKMVEGGKRFDEIYDLFALRVIATSIRDCYWILGVVHAIFKPIPGRFKDYIGMPKDNMYQALHTTVIGPRGEPIEIQIKTQKMHETAEEGIAAHWYYKEGGVKDKGFDSKLSFLRRILEWVKEEASPREFMEALKVDIFADTVFVFTPKGEIKELPKGSCPIDFAYAIHTEIGDHVLGAKVNGKMVPLRYRLNSGDRIEIITSPKAHPSQDWLNLVKTSRARTRIKHWLRERLKEGSLLKEGSKEGRQDTKPPSTLKRPHPTTHGVKICGVEGLNIHLAKCCSPVPNDEIIGYITQSRGFVSIHRVDCRNVLNLVNDPERLLPVSWEEGKGGRYEVGISALANHRNNLLTDILLAISSTSTIINAAQAKLIEGGLTRCNFQVVIEDKDRLERIIREIAKVKGVIEVHRILPK